MFYGIRNGKVFIISEEKTSVKVDEWIESEVKNGVYENGKIISKEKSEEYKRQLEELKQKQLEEKIKKLQEEGYNIDEEGNIIKDEKWLNIKIKKINKWFDEEIEKYTIKYPIYEKMTWPIKQREAEIVANGGKSEYLENLVKDKLKTIDGYSEEEINNILQDKVKEFANLILQKAKEYAIMYSALEAEKDKRIQELKSQIIK